MSIDLNAAQIILQESTYRVLRNSDGQIVASWDEGRWWTPSESEAFTAALIFEMTDA